MSKEKLDDDDDEDQPASPMSQLMRSPSFAQCILVLMGFRTTIDVDLFKKELESTLLNHTRFTSLLIIDSKKRGEFSWKRTSVDVENHVFAPDLDPDMESPDEFVADFMYDISRNPMDMTRPLWEFHVLNVKTTESDSTVILKMHHSMGDGVSLMSLLLACSKNTPLNSVQKHLPSYPTEKQIIIGSSHRHVATRLLIESWKVIIILFNTLVDMLWILATVLFLKDSNTPIRGERRVALSHKRYAHRIIDFDDVKLVKTAMNVTVNDVAMAVAEAGLSGYINMRYGQQHSNKYDVSKTTNLLPKGLRLRSAVCFNLRPGPIIEDLVEIMNDEKKMEGKWGNKIGIALYPHTIVLRDDDPIAYVRRAKAAMDRKKLSLEPKFMAFSLKILIQLFGIKIAAVMTNAIYRNITLTISNIFGPQEEIAPFGHPLCYIAPTVAEYPHALVIHFQSYADKFIISVAADEKLISKPSELCDYMVKSLENIKRSVIERSRLDRDICM